VNDSSELRRAFHSLTINFGDDVLLLQSSFRRGTIFRHPRHNYAALCGKLQVLRIRRSNFVRFTRLAARTLVPIKNSHLLNLGVHKHRHSRQHAFRLLQCLIYVLSYAVTIDLNSV